MSSLQVITGHNVDDDGRPRRTMMTVMAHIINAVIGSGVLTLAWAVAQWGWIAGLTVLLGFAFITYFTSTLLADLFRSPDGTRNRTYTDVVRTNLGGHKVLICGIAQYLNLIGITIGYTLTASISLVAVEKSICFHKEGHDKCSAEKQYPFMILFACIQIMLSQVPNFHKLSWLSVLAAVMSFAYSVICLGLSIAKLAGGGDMKETSLIPMLGHTQVWNSFQAIGNIAFAYAFSTILTEIQDTLKSGPAENEVMKKASLAGVSTTTLFYMLCACTGYAAFGRHAPGNFLTNFGFYEPYWLIAFANICVAVHLIGAYQVFCQPMFSFVEMKCNERWPGSNFINVEQRLRVPYFGAVVSVNLFRLVWRSLYVEAATLIAAKVPFFNELLGLVGAASFYPLTVYFPIEMHISRSRIRRFSRRWIWLKTLSLTCLAVSAVAAAGSLYGIFNKLTKHHHTTPHVNHDICMQFSLQVFGKMTKNNNVFCPKYQFL